MKAAEALCGYVVSFVKNGFRVYRKVCFVKNGLCWFHDGTTIPGYQEVVWQGGNKISSFWIDPFVLEIFSKFACTDFSLVERGTWFLLVDKSLIEGTPEHEAVYYPVFYDSRRNSLWSMTGKEFPVSQFLCIDLEVVNDYFEMTPEGQEKLRNAYPSDI